MLYICLFSQLDRRTERQRPYLSQIVSGILILSPCPPTHCTMLCWPRNMLICLLLYNFYCPSVHEKTQRKTTVVVSEVALTVMNPPSLSLAFHTCPELPESVFVRTISLKSLSSGSVVSPIRMLPVFLILLVSTCLIFHYYILSLLNGEGWIFYVFLCSCSFYYSDLNSIELGTYWQS